MNLYFEKEMEYMLGNTPQRGKSCLNANYDKGGCSISITGMDKMPLTKDEALLIAQFLQSWAKEQPKGQCNDAG